MSKITDLTAQLARPVVEANGCSLWDVEYVKEAGSWYLRVYIDKETGVSIDDCEAVSAGPCPTCWTRPTPFEGRYTLEVSSAGADRVLKKPEHFQRLPGRRGGGEALPGPKTGRKDLVRASWPAMTDGAVTLDHGRRHRHLSQEGDRSRRGCTPAFNIRIEEESTVVAKRTTKTANSNELDGKEFFAAIALIEKEKGIPKSYMLEKITQALVSAYKRDHEGVGDNVCCGGQRGSPRPSACL